MRTKVSMASSIIYDRDLTRFLHLVGKMFTLCKMMMGMK